MSWIFQNGVKMSQIFQNPWVQLFLSQKSRGQFDPLHPSNGGPVRYNLSKIKKMDFESAPNVLISGLLTKCFQLGLCWCSQYADKELKLNWKMTSPHQKDFTNPCEISKFVESLLISKWLNKHFFICRSTKQTVVF